jgi:hypothetical protein
MISDWQNQYYTSALQDIILIIVLLISLKNRKKFIILKHFPIYIVSLLSVSTSMPLYYIAKDANFYVNFFDGLSDYTDYLFTLVEMIILSHFFYLVIKNKIIKILLLFFNILFALFFIYMAIKDKDFYQAISETTQSIVYTAESIILIFFCSAYFVELFKKLPFVDLKNEPVFWVSTGIFFFMACTLPYSLLENHIRNNYANYLKTSYSIFHVFYILLFLMIIRAYLCKPQKTI